MLFAIRAAISCPARKNVSVSRLFPASVRIEGGDTGIPGRDGRNFFARQPLLSRLRRFGGTPRSEDSEIRRDAAQRRKEYLRINLSAMPLSIFRRNMMIRRKTIPLFIFALLLIFAVGGGAQLSSILKGGGQSRSLSRNSGRTSTGPSIPLRRHPKTVRTSGRKSCR